MRRDGALARLSSITGAIAVATIAAVGVLGVYIEKALPGHHTTTSNTAGSATSGNSGTGTGTGTGNSGANSGTNGQGSLTPPSTPTQKAPAPAPVTSGAS